MSINNFGPFDANVWGTFSEFMMFLLTLGTIIYVVKTFNTQKQLLEIEKERFISSIMPVFSVSATMFSDKELKIQFKNTNHSAQSVAAVFTRSNHWSIWGANGSALSLSDGVENDLLSLGDILPNEDKEVFITITDGYDVLIRFSIFFFNVDRTKQYIQYCSYNSSMQQLIANLPIVLKPGTNIIQ